MTDGVARVVRVVMVATVVLAATLAVHGVWHPPERRASVSTNAQWTAVAAASAPGRVRGVVVWPGNGQITISWTAPSNPGSPVAADFGVLMYDGQTLVSAIDATSSPVVVKGLTNSQVRGYRVVASNSVGPGPESEPLAKVAPAATPFAPFGSWSAWVTELAPDLLGRPATASESSTWTKALTAGTLTPPAFVAQLRRSTDNLTNVDPVARLYRAYFLRTPDPGGLRHWIAKRRSGTSLNTISQSFARSGEFVRRYGSLGNDAFVQLIYQNLFGRSGDPAGVAYWTKQLDLGKKSRGQVMAGFSESSEYVRKQVANVEVSAQCVLLLDRAPTPLEVLDAVDPDVTPESLAARLLRGSEFTSTVTG